MKRLLQAMCLFLLALVLVPTVALARDYAVTDVNIYADVQTDGSVQVFEQRTYDFSGEFNGIYWDIPCGSYEGREIEATDIAVFVNGADKALAPGEYEVEEHGDYIRLTINYHVVNKSVTFEVWYTLTNLVTRWADVGELYWQYVPADEDSGKEWPNVTCTVHLYAPEGEKIEPGENVHAWGHGPLDGTVSFKDDSVVFSSPGVGYKEYLEARMAFPAEWLDRMSEGSEEHLDTILEEEAEWVKDANAQRRNARIGKWGTPIAMIVAGIGSVVTGVLGKMGFFKKKQVDHTFTDTYFRDVPSDDHPAVLGKLYNDGKLTGNEFTATLMNLVDRGKIALDTVEVEKLIKKNKVIKTNEWRLTRVHVPAQKSAYAFATSEQSKAIDDAAMSFVYKTVAGNKSLDDRLRGYKGEPYVLASFFEDVAHKAAKEYEDGYNRWSGAVCDAYDARGFVEGTTETSLFPGVIGLADFALATVLGVAGLFLGAPDFLLIPGVVLLFGAGIFCVMVDDSGPEYVYSQQAVDLKAKLEALKRWLTDFTKLKEAIPTDVVLWNRLLVMATVLGVADKVINQLKVAAPQLLANEDFNAYGWYAGNAIKPAADLVAKSFDEGRSSSYGALHTYSNSDLADSSDSSYSGGGGGFSGGGGGGFSGGGGRGGAF